MKGQASVEYVMIALVVGLMILPATYLIYSFSKSSSAEIQESQINRVGNDLVKTAEKIYYQGAPARLQLTATLPDSVQSMRIDEDPENNVYELVITAKVNGKVSEYAFPSKVNIGGLFPRDAEIAGIKEIRIEAIESDSPITGIIIVGAKAVLNVTHYPPAPNPEDVVTLRADFESVAPSVRIFLNDAEVSHCKYSPCYYGAALPEGAYTYYAVASDALGNSLRDPSDPSAKKTFSVTLGREPPCGIYGDINNDGLITRTDVELITSIFSGGSFSSDQRTRADVTGNGRVNSLDASKVNNYIDRYENTFPICQSPITNGKAEFTNDPSDDSTPSHSVKPGGIITFSAKANDAEGDEWYMLVCKTPATNNKDCESGEWCRSLFSQSGSTATCSYQTAGADVPSKEWYAFACDGIECGTTENSNSPFYVDITPPLTRILSVEDDASDPFIDTKDDGSTLVLVHGEDNMACKWYDSDAAYSESSGSTCIVNSAIASCQVPSSEGMITSFISCKDFAGNAQSSDQNLDVSWTVSSSPPVVKGTISYTGECKSGSTITLACRATDRNQDDNSLIVKLWAGQCSSSNCFATRAWATQSSNDVSYFEGSEMVAPAVANDETNGVLFTKEVIISQPSGTSLAATCVAIDNTEKESNWGDTYPVCAVDGCVSNPSFSSITISPSPAKAGIISIRFTSSKPLASNPSVTVKPQGGIEYPASMISSAEDYHYQFEITSHADGNAEVLITGSDISSCQGSSLANFIIDKTPPVTSASRSANHVSLTCSDSGTGCSAIRYCSDSSNTCSPETSYSTPFVVSGNGFVRYFGSDNAANNELPKSFSFDLTAPSTSITSVEGDTTSPYTDNSANSITNIVLSGNEAIICKKYTTDTAYSESSGDLCSSSDLQSTCSITTPSDASYSTYISCKDAANNMQSSTQNLYVQWTVLTDTSAPAISISHSPVNPTTSDTVTISGSTSATDLSQIKIYIDGINVKTCTASPCSHAQTFTTGTHFYYFTAVDFTGNTNRNPVSGSISFTVSVPNTAPAFITTPNDGSTSASPTQYGQAVSFTAIASDSQNDQWKLLVCKTNAQNGGTCSGGQWCSGSLVASSSTSGCTYTTTSADMPSKEWYAFACDSFNACSASNSANSPFYVIPPDTTPPTLSNPQPTGISPSAAKLIVSSSENANCRFSTTSGFNFDSATQFSSTGSTSHSHTLTALPDGTHTYYFNCKDIVGNLGNQVSVTFTTFGGACADGGTEEYISTKTTNLCNGCQTYYRIYGCGGSKTAFEANNLCGAGWSLCSPYQLEDQPKPVASYWTALGAADCSARPETDYWCCVGCSCSSAPPYSHISSGLYTGIPYALRFSPLTNIAYIQPSQNCNGRYYRSYVEPVNPNLLSGAVCCETEIRSPAGCGCSSGNNDD